VDNSYKVTPQSGIKEKEIEREGEREHIRNNSLTA